MNINRERRKNPLRFGFYIILAGFILFIGVGLLNPGIEVDSFSQIKSSTEEVNPTLSQVDNIKKWLGSIKTYEIVQGTKSTEGSRYNIIFVDGQKGQLTLQKLSKSEGIYQYVIETDITQSDVTVTTKALEGDKTDLHLKNKITGKDIFTKSILIFLKSVYSSEADKAINKLKDEIEN